MLSDPEDDMVLETATNGSASAIVTFNQRDFASVRLSPENRSLGQLPPRLASSICPQSGSG
jgi:predicted nucleic acid-binding protein